MDISTFMPYSLGWLFLAVFTLILIYLSTLLWTSKRLPPGLQGLAVVPFLIRLVRRDAAMESYDLLQKFGDIASVSILNLRTFIFLGSQDLAKEAYQKSELSDKPTAIVNHGILRTNGTVWKVQRRFALSTMRDFGMGKIAQEERILNECQDLIKQFEKQKLAFDPRSFLSCAVTNIIAAVVFSHRYDYNDEEFRTFMLAVGALIRDTSVARRIIPQRLQRYIPGLRGTIKQFTQNRQVAIEIVKKFIREHKESFNEGNIRDYIDAYLSVMNEEKDEATTFTDEQLVHTCFDLFVAGSETTGTTLRWALALMALNPDIQAKVHKDIDENIGRDRLPNMADKSRLIFTEAVLLEVQRYATVVPTIVHQANEDTEVAGYPIEKGYLVIVNFLKVHRDARVWPFPNEFNVNNFLKDGTIINRASLASFSVGKRSCIGESLARMELYLIFAALMQSFTFTFAKGEEPDLNSPITSIVRAPHDYEILARTRPS